MARNVIVDSGFLVALVRRDNDLSEFRVTLPPEAAQWKQLEVAIENPMQAPLRFGYAEVR